MVMVDMLSFAMDNLAPATIVLISGDRDFVYALSVLRNRCYTIVLIVPHMNAPVILKSQANVVLEWKSNVLQFNTGMDQTVNNTLTANAILAIPNLNNRATSTSYSDSERLVGTYQLPLNSTPDFQKHDSGSTGVSTTFNNQKNISAGTNVYKKPNIVHQIVAPNFQNQVHYFGSTGSNTIIHQKDYYACTNTNQTKPNIFQQIVTPNLQKQVHYFGSTGSNTIINQKDCSACTNMNQTKPKIAPQVVAPGSTGSNAIINQKDCSACTNIAPQVVTPIVQTPMKPGFFDNLFDILVQLKVEGESKPLRSKVGMLLLQKYPCIYQRTEASTFKQLTKLAMQEGLIVSGGTDACAWIALSE